MIDLRRPAMVQKTASTYRSPFVRGSHRFQIVGYSQRKDLAGVIAGNSSTIRSGDFEAGGHTWALSCRFGKQGLASISLNLVSAKHVTAMASLWIDDPRRSRWPAAVWRSDVPNVFRSYGEAWRWELSVPEAFRGHEERYVDDDDCLSILCVVDVLDLRATRVQTKNCFISLVPPPTLSRDFLGLLLPPKSKSPSGSVQQRHRRPDVTFIVEEIQIQAHKILLAMESPVFAAEFRWHNDESSIIIRVDDMTASTFRAMLRFIYTGEMPIKHSRKDANMTCGTDKEKCTPRRFEAMALDLLVAADRYELERLRTLCGNVLIECMDAVSVIPILMVVQGRYSYQKLEDSCIEYVASHPGIYTAMKETEDYKELKESCCSFLLEITDKIATRNMTSSPSSNLRSVDSTPSSNNMSKVVHGTHVFTIPNFRAVQRSFLVVEDEIASGTFHIGGYAWKICVYISKSSLSWQEQETIKVFLELCSDVGTADLTTSVIFKMDYPTATPQIEQVRTKTFIQKLDCASTEFRVMKSAKPAHVDDSLAIHCELTIIEEAACATSPSSDIASSHLEHLLVSQQGSDLRFLVEECDLHAHGLVIAARSPALYEMVAAAASSKDSHIVVHVHDMKATVFRSVLYFIYTDKLPSMENLDLTVVEDMLAAACRFGLERMKMVCENFLAKHMPKENALKTLKLAQRYHCLKLQNYCLEFMSSSPQVTKHLLKSISLD